MRNTYKKISSHGSISIPVAMRREMGMEPGDPVELSVTEENHIRVSAYRTRCIFCGAVDEEGMARYRNKGVCPGCAAGLKEEFS